MNTLIKLNSALLFLLLFISIFTCSQPQAPQEAIPVDTISPDDPLINYVGRFDFRTPGCATYEWPGSSVQIRFEGRVIGFVLKHYVNLINERYRANYYNLFIDDRSPIVIRVGRDTIISITSLGEGSHMATLFKRTEGFCGKDALTGILLEHEMQLLPITPGTSKKIEYIGDSQTCGYGNEETDPIKCFTSATENSYQTYAGIASRALGAQYHLISYSGKGLQLNSDSSMLNTLPKIYRRTCPLDSTSRWNFATWIPDAVVINLGTNDFGATGAPDSISFIRTYHAFIDEIRLNYPRAAIICICGPMMISQERFLKNEKFQRLPGYIVAVIASARAKGLKDVYAYKLSGINTENGFGAERHPSVYQHTKNGVELANFIRTVLHW